VPKLGNDVVGVIGMGNIGRGLADHLAESFDVVGYDPLVAPGLTDSGVRAVESVAALAGLADVVCLSLPSAAASQEVVRELVAAKPCKVQVVIEMSTIGEKTVVACGKIAAAAGVGYLDAPISGGPAGSRAGKLTAMIAGPVDVRQRAQCVLAAACSHIVDMGETVGHGQVVKIVNNVINSTSIAITSEAVSFAVSRGLDLAQVLDVLNSSSGRTQASEVKFPQTVVTGTFLFGSDNRIVAKDMGLFRDAAATGKEPYFVAERTIDLWTRFATECPGADTMEIYPYIRDRIIERTSD
jgi:3-hydroxyisobutyrate dehydrogenase-like beta-hydroxyacid dehydrogenase